MGIIRLELYATLNLKTLKLLCPRQGTRCRPGSGRIRLSEMHSTKTQGKIIVIVKVKTSYQTYQSDKG